MNAGTTRLILVGLVLLAVIMAPFLARGDQESQRIIARNAKVIAGMSVSQRERLNQNFRDYLSLSQAEREKLQAYHHQIEQDRISNHGELSKALKIYDGWLKSLNPHQRDQLQKTTESPARLALVRDFLNRQREETGRRLMPLPMFPRGRGERPFDVLPPMDDATRLAIFKKLESLASDRLTDVQMEEVTSLQGIRREIRLLQFLKAKGPGDTTIPLLDQLPGELIQVTQDIRELTQDQKLLDFLNNGPSYDSPEGRKTENPGAHRLAILLRQAMTVELIRLRQATEEAVDEARLRDFLETLPDEDQKELLSLDALDFYTDLKKQYLDRPQSRETLALPQFREVNDLFVDRNVFRRQFGGDRSGSARPPRRPDGRDPMNEGFDPGRPPGPPPFERGSRPEFSSPRFGSPTSPPTETPSR